MNREIKVLLIDDDADFLRACSLLLKEAGYTVFTAEDGPAGLAAARDHKPDVAVIDVVMNRPDEGFVLARAIRADANLDGIKLIVMTGAGPRFRMIFEPDELWLPVDKVMEKAAPAEELIEEISRLAAEPSGKEEQD